MQAVPTEAAAVTAADGSGVGCAMTAGNELTHRTARASHR
ncbi:hypothetical protein BZL30_5062 [Mycobacterium kansasii]|uniref:Uncharacterized protein n=1 Tax=Mycobacterium kansasii TaxID=1768 RepID=A0A1V3X4L3_MYCKA|nr:hypothetical protein BZL30_5062 [Mycobacterium kansasii]